MTKYALKISLRYKKLQFEKGVGKSIPKIITELLTNSDDSYKRLKSSADPTFGEITITANYRKKKISITDQAEGMSSKLMVQKFQQYGEDSGDRQAGLRTRSLFGKGLRDALFTQKGATVRSISNNECAISEFYFGKMNGSENEEAIVDVQDHPPRISNDLRKNWGIKNNGTQVEFRLREDLRFPSRDTLLKKLSSFYMLRMINSNPSRRIILRYIDKVNKESKRIQRFDSISFSLWRVVNKKKSAA